MKPILFIMLFFFTCCFGTVAFAQDKQSKKQPAAVEEVVIPEWYVASNQLKWVNVPAGRQVEIFTILGNKVKQIEIKSPEGVYDLNLPRAIYIFRLDGVVKKFVIR